MVWVPHTGTKSFHLTRKRGDATNEALNGGESVRFAAGAVTNGRPIVQVGLLTPA